MNLYPLLVPAGSDGQIQYNDGNLFGGDSSLTWDDGAAKALTIGNCAVLGSDSAVFQPNADSTTFFQVKNAAGTSNILSADTSDRTQAISVDGHILVGGGIDFIEPFGGFDAQDNAAIQIYRDIASGGLNIHYASFNFVANQSRTTGLVGTMTFMNTAIVSTEKRLGQMAFLCDGATNKGAFTITLANAASPVIQFWMSSDGKLGLGGESTPETLVEWTNTEPYATFHNSTHEDTDGGGESRIIGKREDGAGTETAAGQIEISHDGAGANDQLGKMTLGVNTGAGVVDVVTLNSLGILKMEDDKLIAFDVNAGLTASTTQSQGQGALTAQVNEISTVANDDDTVTLPTAVTGITIEIVNNGANTLQIFPASGDDLGLGVDVAEELEANESVGFVAYDTTNWAKESTTEIIHAEIHDEDNTDAFVINDAGGDFHSYHTNGLVAGDLADWTFDAGGAGTSFPIASIANSVGSPGTQILVTTTGAHGLAVGDIISQTNLADAAYVGIFEVIATAAATTYEVTASYTATGTGTMDQAATLTADAVAAGVYSFAYYVSGTLVGNNETFDFQLYNEATAVIGSKVRRKYGAANDFGSASGGGVVAVANGDKISLAISNEDSAANIILRNVTIVLVRL